MPTVDGLHAALAGIASDEAYLRAVGSPVASLVSRATERLGDANRGGPWKARQRALQTTLAESVDEYRALEASRLDAMLNALWDEAMAGKIDAVREILAIVMAQARLLGLDSGKPGWKPDGPTGVVLP